MRYLTVVNIINTESVIVITRGWGQRKWGVICLMGIECQLYKMKRLMRIDDNGGCITIRMYLISVNCVFKNG